MTNAPYLLPKARAGYRMGNQEVLDHMFYDGLQSPWDGKLMGCFAEATSEKYNFTRKAQDDFAAESVRRALVLARESFAESQGRKPLARILGYASFAREPEWFTLAPVGAIQKLLAQLNWHSKDVDLYEINEAFASVPMAAMRDLDLDHRKVNVNGGACALGHPIGATGARIMTTLLYALRARGKKRGIASLCIGGGEATAIGIELM
jgi:acetyl-CoA C-acetyltransferase